MVNNQIKIERVLFITFAIPLFDDYVALKIH